MIDTLRVYATRTISGILMSLTSAWVLTACGGGNSDSNTNNAPPSSEAPLPGINQGRSGSKVLLVQVDGLQYDVLQAAVTSGKLPGFASLQIAQGWSGGQAGTSTEQATTPGPSWASLLTGTWASSHSVRWDTKSQRIDQAQAPSAFTLAKQHSAQLLTGAVTGKALYNTLLSPEVSQGTLNTAIDCADSDACVTEHTAELIAQGYDLLVAQYGAPARAALNETVHGASYEQALVSTSNALSTLLERIQQRKANDVSENWLVVLTSGYGLDIFGSASGLQDTPNKSIVIAATPGLPTIPVASARTDTTRMIYQLPALTDIAPTVLQHLGVTPSAEHYAFHGMALQNANIIRDLRAAGTQEQGVRGGSAAQIALSWTLREPQRDPIQILRDGILIATLAADATTYVDPIVAVQSGSYAYRYTVLAGKTMTATQATLNYEKPATLTTDYLKDLLHFYALDDAAVTSLADAKNTSTLRALQPNADGGRLFAEDTFLSNPGKALNINSTLRGTGNQGGYRLVSQKDVTTDSSVRAFSIGFWLRVDDTCKPSSTAGTAYANAASVIANKDYASGNNKGIAIGIFDSCELKFNAGDGSSRNELAGFTITPNRWAYVTMSIDKDTAQLNGYLFDAVRGLQSSSMTLGASKLSNLGGLGNGFGLNEDGTGTFNYRFKGKSRDRMEFNDLAIWQRAITAEEVRVLYMSGHSLSSLIH